MIRVLHIAVPNTLIKQSPNFFRDDFPDGARG